MTPEQIKDRERALHAYIESFVKNLQEKEGVKIEVDLARAAENICALYFRYTEEIVRPTIESGIVQNYKIIANTELAVLRVAPLVHSENEKKQRLLNARLALQIGLSMLIEWNEMDEGKALKLLHEDKDLKTFIREHTTWLYLLDARYQYPIFSNSQVWRLFHYLLRDRIKQM